MASAADSHQPAVNFPNTKTKHDDLCKNNNRVANGTLPSLSLRFPGSANNGARRPTTTETTPRVGDGDAPVSVTDGGHVRACPDIFSSSHFSIVAGYATGEATAARCPEREGWENNRWPTSAFFHHSPNVPALTSSSTTVMFHPSRRKLKINKNMSDVRMKINYIRRSFCYRHTFSEQRGT